MFEVYMTWKLNSFLNYEQYSFTRVLGKSLKNNAPPTPPMLTCNTHTTHANIFQAFSSQIPKGNLVVFTCSNYFYSLYCFIEVSETDTEKSIFLEETSLIQKTTIFSMCNFLKKNCFLTLASFWQFYIF